MQKISNEFEFRPDRTTDYGVSCSWTSKKFPYTYNRKWWCLHASSFIFDRIIIKFVAGNQERHKNSVELDFGPNQTTHFGVTCPWVTKLSLFWTWISLKPVGQSWANFMCIIGVGERLHKVLGQIGSKFSFPWQQKAPIDLQWGKWCPPFLGCFWSRPFEKTRFDLGRTQVSDRCPLGYLLVNLILS